MKVLVIIPAFNEEGNIRKLVFELNKLNVDVIVINDKSTDNTLKILSELKVNYIDLPCNLGIGGAVQTGYTYGVRNGYDVAVQVDGDGQHDPNYLLQIITPVLNGEADMIIGSRYIEKEGFQSSVVRRIGIKYFSSLIRLLTGMKITDPTSGFRACNLKVMNYFANYYPTDYPEPESIVALLRQNYRILEVPVIMSERQFGSSSINLMRSIYYVIKVSLAILIDRFRKKELVESLELLGDDI
ncbi:glycosyltransferase family 2 protein [Paenibacillus sp. FSL R5-0636]|uniref:glycosyltransferase family 2 protein n=1 Tax=Paenibacillus TaxID=44249 RepID=UPI00096F6931|nr:MULTISPECIES: glycosyltransferase family 2 protein [Paenibacillus]MDH6428617.1 glycosyltransferase involved in cell wall biosynthesis [Paenibacillus sp. PastH-4]MDH6444817.1 glycosyltransferase involved in cell wall biosynthesis [Paenibacillus sp. PastF-4]MDH6528712.1 glycosyltransferase involved in cell wall biosynthesis [Paenibacillus sp. PastH-3]OMC64288.1 glycosyl transferase family 2 [Paenibacillus odorifer]OMD00784.1 glycosyl transferase family 2 [Paenibacillus odorifer]